MTPSTPPRAVTSAVSQYGKPVHHPIMTRPGSTKIMADSVPAADAIVWTILFSTTEWSRKERRMAMEMTAAGIEVAKVRPTFRPR